MSKELHYTVLNTPLGEIGLVAGDRGLVLLEFLEYTVKKYAEILQNNYPNYKIIMDGEYIQEPVTQINEYFTGSRKEFTMPLNLQGTDFQRKVWQALQEIPYGETCSYQDIANKLNNTAAVRAVGQANGKNPISIIVPCHRVINKSGKLGGYGSGLGIKKWLLDWEALNNV